jgi:hypothetical protein
MSNRYKGAVISATPPTTTGGEDGTASGAWTLEQQMQLQAAGLWPIQPLPKYIEDVFSTYLYTGNGSTQTITNGIDLSTKGGLVWIKARTDTSGGATSHALVDTVRGSSKWLSSNASGAQATNANLVTGFTSSGFSVGTAPYFANESSIPYVSWTFREQPKFFDIVTYTGDGTAGRTIAHNLGSVPGCIIVKQLGGGSTGGANNWFVYHRSLGGTKYLGLDGTFAAVTSSSTWNNTDPTSTVFTIGGTSDCNDSGGTYVAYLFAHDAGGFGLTGTDNVISCGSYTGSSSDVSINLGYEAQWILVKNTSRSGTNWQMLDIMRGMPLAGTAQTLAPNLSDAESSLTAPVIVPTATGVKITGGLGFSINYNGDNYIYIAIRRGPMAVPTLGTSVFSPNQTSGTTGTPITTGFPIDWQILGINAGNGSNQRVSTRLTGVNTNGSSNSQLLITTSTAAEAATGSLTLNWGNTGFQVPSLNSGSPIIAWNFKRAPSFFDVVCFTGDGTNPRSLSHNLTVAPTLIITKKRNSTSNWITGFDFASTTYKYFYINDAGAANPDTYASTPVYGGNPTASVFIVGNQGNMNQSGDTYVAYLFATCAGVSKVGSYTGTGTTLQVNCGFTAGSRFVLIKRTDSTGDWYVWDSARGIIAGNDPYLLLNTTAAEVTGTDYVDTYNAGFEISSTAPAAINANGGTFIFLAIA